MGHFLCKAVKQGLQERLVHVRPPTSGGEALCCFLRCFMNQLGILQLKQRDSCYLLFRGWKASACHQACLYHMF